MRRIQCTFGYDGTFFSGFQAQPKGRTVQEEIERALAKLHKGNSVAITASGRTDAGVHAVGQVMHFDTPLQIPISNWKKAMQTVLPKDIEVYHFSEVHDRFHSRYDVQSKEYRYRVLLRKDPDVFRRHYTYYMPYKVDVEKVKEACQLLIGTHDFTSFSSAKATVKGSKVRTLYQASCEHQGDELVFIFKGTGFLYNMVRILVGTLLEVGNGRLKPHDITRVLVGKNRQLAGKTAPPHGLFLWQVNYDKK